MKTLETRRLAAALVAGVLALSTIPALSQIAQAAVDENDPSACNVYDDFNTLLTAAPVSLLDALALVTDDFYTIELVDDITTTGDLTIDTDFFFHFALNSYTLTVGGDLLVDKASTDPIFLNGQLIVEGDLISSDHDPTSYEAALSLDGVAATILGQVTASGNGIRAYGGSAVTIEQGVSAAGGGVLAENSSITVGPPGVRAGGYAVFSKYDSVVSVDGDVMFSEDPAADPFATLLALDGGAIAVTGNLTAKNDGIQVWDGRVYLGGDLTAPGGYAVNASGDYEFGSEVTIDGKVQASKFILFWDDDAWDVVEFTEADFSEPTTLTGYRTYTNEALSEPASFVWVKIQPPNPPQPEIDISTGGLAANSTLAWPLALLLAISSAAGTLLWRRQRQITPTR